MTSSPHIVLVDDDQQVIRYLKRSLEESGYAVTAATSGTDALSLVEERVPDLLILDLNMPDPTGFDILKIERTKFPGLRILVISGMQQEVLEAANILGAVATLEKPVVAEVLVAKVREVLGR